MLNKKLTQIFSLLMIMMALPLSVVALDMSDYRQNTYGAPTRYCEPTKALNNIGMGTLALDVANGNSKRYE